MAAPIRMVGGAGPAIQLQLDPRDIAKAKANIAKYADKPMAERMARGTVAAARMLVGPIRSYAPKGPTGNLRKSIRAGQNRRSATVFGTRDAYVGPSARVAPHRHLVIRGHRIVTPGGRDTGRRTQPNPFVDAATARHVADVERIMAAEIWPK